MRSNKRQPENHDRPQTESIWLDFSGIPRKLLFLGHERLSSLNEPRARKHDTVTDRYNPRTKRTSIFKRWFFDGLDSHTVTAIKDRYTTASRLNPTDLIAFSPVILPTIVPASDLPTNSPIEEDEFNFEGSFQNTNPPSSTLGAQNNSNIQGMGVGAVRESSPSTISGGGNHLAGEMIGEAQNSQPLSSATEALGSVVKHHPLSSTMLSNGKELDAQITGGASSRNSSLQTAEQVNRTENLSFMGLIVILPLSIGIFLAIKFRKDGYAITWRPLKVTKASKRGTGEDQLNFKEDQGRFEKISSDLTEPEYIKNMEKRVPGVAMDQRQETFDSTRAEVGQNTLSYGKQSTQNFQKFPAPVPIFERIRKFISFKGYRKPVRRIFVASGASMPRSKSRDTNSPPLPSFFKVPDRVLRKSHRAEPDMKWIDQQTHPEFQTSQVSFGMSPLKNSPMNHDLQHLWRDTVELHRIRTDEIQTIYLI